MSHANQNPILHTPPRRGDSCLTCKGKYGEDLTGGYYESGGSSMKMSVVHNFQVGKKKGRTPNVVGKAFNAHQGNVISTSRCTDESKLPFALCSLSASA